MADTYIVTTGTNKILQMRKRIRLVAGGMRASKTDSIIMALTDSAQSDPKPTLTSVVSESMPHLKRGAIRDFKDILVKQGYWEDSRWHGTDFIYTFPYKDHNGKVYPRGSQIEFFSADQPSKVHGPTRQRLFGNEVNNIPQPTWEQLLLRTEQYAFADWNPVTDFYMYEDYGLDDEAPIPVASDDRVDFIILTYKDNEALEPAIREDIERKAKLNPGWSRVYAEGKRGNIEGKIFKGWKVIDEVPHEARLEVGGGDFGYARDKTAFCDIYYYNGGYIIDEIVSRVGLLDTDLGNILLNRPNPNLLYIGDSADKQKLVILQNMGLNIIGVDKRGSSGDTFTRSAISFVQDQQISITKHSINYLDSYRNFMWQTDKEGRVIPKYDHFKSDEMMSVIYAMTNFDTRRRLEEEDEEVYSGELTGLWR